MKVATGFIFYFLISVMAITFSMVIFVLRPFRSLLHKVQTKYSNILNNQLFSGFVYFSFAIIGIILLESLYTYFKIHNQLTSRKSYNIKNHICLLKLVCKIWIWSTGITVTALRTLYCRFANTKNTIWPNETSC